VAVASCPRCGAASGKGQRFCRQCGGPLGSAEATIVTPATNARAEATAPGRDPKSSKVWWIVLAVAVGFALASVAVLVVVLVGSRSDSDAGTSEVTVPRTANTAPVEPTTPSTVAPVVPTTTAVPGHVARTCGRSGDGDCFLTVRVAPSTSSSGLQRLDEGDPIDVVCQVTGEPVRSSSLGQSSSAWSRTTAGTYVASVFVDAAGFDPLRVSVPCA
jgi:hypothetical protein